MRMHCYEVNLRQQSMSMLLVGHKSYVHVTVVSKNDQPQPHPFHHQRQSAAREEVYGAELVGLNMSYSEARRLKCKACHEGSGCTEHVKSLKLGHDWPSTSVAFIIISYQLNVQVFQKYFLPVYIMSKGIYWCYITYITQVLHPLSHKTV